MAVLLLRRSWRALCQRRVKIKILCGGIWANLLAAVGVYSPHSLSIPVLSTDPGGGSQSTGNKVETSIK